VISSRWLDQRAPSWRRLEDLLTQTGPRNLRALTPQELQELGLLYRQVAADLATVREDPGSQRVAASLNQLLARAHHTIYGAERREKSRALRFIRSGFPAACRDNAGQIVTAFAVFIVAAVVGAALTLRNPDFGAKVLGPEMVDTIERRQMWTHSIVAVKPLASSAIMTNNMSVAFMMFALGMTAGLGTIYLLFFNGLLIGVVSTACAVSGMSVPLWSFIAPHGALELPAIFIAGGAGLRLGQAMLFPGVLPRGYAIRQAGGSALTLIIGCVPVLIVAGIIEAFVSPTSLAIPMKFAMSGALLALLTWYLVLKPIDDSVL
jgi:uncharacterized membrane protein SpoIIM required for sporulation